LHWGHKILLFDVTPPIIGKNIDVILLKHETKKGPVPDLLEDQNNYIACGELKGGIDPAGADEHWKTANSALGRIRGALKGKSPKLFFVAAAIEAAMAKEIFSQLTDGRLNYAANLNNDLQVKDLVGWLITL
jgi:type II restriction enzyme